MLAGGVGYANAAHSQKKHPEPGDKIVVREVITIELEWVVGLCRA
jgi:hypothetical protein